MNPSSLSAYQFDLPQELIAQYPASPRDSARLLIVHRRSGLIEEATVADLPSILQSGDGCVFNNTKVLHSSLCGQLVSGAAISCVLVHAVSLTHWLVLANPARKLMPGTIVQFPGLTATVDSILEDGRRLMVFSEPVTEELLLQIGSIPLPPYIRRKPSVTDAHRYQTIYASSYGAAAAPTAGLHFTEDVFNNFKLKGISSHYVTLHVGTGTFLPIRTENIFDHKMHSERFSISDEEASRINVIPGRRIAIGTTSCRVLESVAQENGKISACSGETQLFITPGYQFKAISGLFTNFHTPGSSLLVLVSAFMGYDLMKKAYTHAIDRKFRFFSYGDAMLIL